MAVVRVVTDSTADMNEHEAGRLGIVSLPLIVRFGTESYRDKVDLSLGEFYRKLRSGNQTPTTSQPPVGEFVQVYEEILRQADEIVSVHLGSAFSGTFTTAEAAARMVDSRRVTVVDSGTVAYPLGSLVLEMARAAACGASAEECVRLADQLKPRLRLFAILDTLEFLRRGGRIGRVQAWAGAVLSIKPIVQVLGNQLLPVERVRTRNAAVRRAAELVRGLGDVEELAILHADDSEPANMLEESVRSFRPEMVIKRGTIGPVIGTHTGPGPFGFAAVVSK